MPINGKLHMTFDDTELPKGRYDSRHLSIDFISKGITHQTLKKDMNDPPKHFYEHTVEMKWRSVPEGGGPKGIDKFPPLQLFDSGGM
eukprot:NODE_6336_length_514_cov_301.335512.p1 GENE.NODE_6336_length_514_cov_301.335512~~NODE_6336_length_514_cov_301.335512.p1  ORF type:complete len:87 (-),score=28.12 NODE_6336_length_514_cov_301.335512:132-392(-)